MMPVIGWGWYFLLGFIIIAALWYRAYPALIDRPVQGRKNGFDQHSKYHVLGAFVVALLVGVLTGDAVGGGACAFLLFLVVEIAQKKPRDKRGGFFEWYDVFPCNFAGALLGMLAVAALFHRWTT